MPDSVPSPPVEPVDNVLRRSADEARPSDLIDFLDRAGDEPPVAGDAPLKAS